ncbi:MAG: DUF1003 domain-containing protein [Bacteroidia bacterium]|nr:DUF1003 domain-containing protein [Bacteroidia bacterium]
MDTFISDISKKEFPITEKVLGKFIRPSIFAKIRQEYPDFKVSGCISTNELNVFRQKYISSFMVKELKELSELEETVLNSLKSENTLVDKVEDALETRLTTGQRIADNVASFGGSWTFIISFSLFILAWIVANIFWLANKGFDPYPFILLNLILSCVAAFQAPVIMMSQNRQEEKDRERAKKDYMINLKSELEIRMLHEKIDHLIMHEQQELIEIQKVQIEMMNDILTRIDRK